MIKMLMISISAFALISSPMVASQGTPPSRPAISAPDKPSELMRIPRSAQSPASKTRPKYTILPKALLEPALESGELKYTNKTFKLKDLIKGDEFDLSDPVFKDVSNNFFITTNPEKFFRQQSTSYYGRISILITTLSSIEEKSGSWPEHMSICKQKMFELWKTRPDNIGIFIKRENSDEHGIDFVLVDNQTLEKMSLTELLVNHGHTCRNDIWKNISGEIDTRYQYLTDTITSDLSKDYFKEFFKNFRLIIPSTSLK